MNTSNTPTPTTPNTPNTQTPAPSNVDGRPNPNKSGDTKPVDNSGKESR